MKKLFIALALTSSLFSCKKVTTNTNSTTNTSNGVTCVDNPNINFTAIGTPVGKFSDCIKDVDGNTYKTVTIGTQIWMAENLKTSKYNDGTSIPNVKDSLEWSKLTMGAWCYYNNDEKNNSKYGKLYNWYTVNSTGNGNKNLCPSGWHVPTGAEWSVLTDYLGGAGLAGGKMKEVGITSWDSPNTDATNTSLFTGLPGGIRTNNSYYYYIGYDVYFWSSTVDYLDSLAWCRNLYFIKGRATSYVSEKKSGFSVRCLKD
jgi:uncharacterized protein (TIGR02145 family)